MVSLALGKVYGCLATTKHSEMPASKRWSLVRVRVRVGIGLGLGHIKELVAGPGLEEDAAQAQAQAQA